MRRLIWSLMFVLVAGALVAGCGGGGGGGGTMEVTLTTSGDDLKFSPNTFELKAGSAVKLTYNNQSRMEHDFVIPGLPTKEGKPVTMKVAAGQSGNITFTPSKAGEYNAECTVLGHKDGGMVAKVSVK